MPRSLHRSSLAVLLALLAAPASPQSSGGSSGTFSGAGIRAGERPGAELPKPGGGSFFADGHRNGRAPALTLEEIRSGRLVNVHGLQANGSIDPEPVYRDFLVGETVQSDGAGYLLYTSLSTQVAHLVVLRVPGAPEPSPGAGTFTDLVRDAEQATTLVPPRDPGSTLVASAARNAALGLRFGDLLDDGTSASTALASTVQVRVGSDGGAPALPFPARVFFDPNHGAVVQGAFHSTRVIVDTTVSALEASEMVVPQPVNGFGLPASSDVAGANVLLRLPSRTDPGSGQFERLANLAGRGLSTSLNGPVDEGSPTRDVLRALRSGRADEPSHGFLLDLEPPQVVGAFGVSVTQAQPDPAGAPGFAFLVDWTYLGPCRGRPLLGDALEVGGRTLELVANGPAPDASGSVQGVRVQLAQRTPASVTDLLGAAVVAARLRPGTEASACWFHLVPAPALPPARGVATSASVGLRFSEPMEPASIEGFDTFRLVEGALGAPADALDTVVAEIHVSGDGVNCTLEPVLPLAHVLGQATLYHAEVVAGATDLAGNALALLPAAELRIDRNAPTQTSGGIVLRFDDVDEVPGIGRDVRGNALLDLASGTLRSRPPVHFGVPVDRNNPVPSIMIPFPSGVQTPLAPLGSKLHNVWRYCDLGWSLRDESKYDVDVTGIDWSPVGGTTINDYFPQFEIRLAHASRLPDEGIGSSLLPRWPNSGLVGAGHPYTDNVLQDPNGTQKIVHPRAAGYRVNPADLFQASTGTPLMPFPLNRGPGPDVTYTWRDTSVLAKGGPGGTGVPLDVEVGPPLFLEPHVGDLAPAEEVPSIGLPLLFEYRCYPTDLGLGLNQLDVSLAINSSAQPSFRSFSTGGVGTNGVPVAKDPDLEAMPSGGFNPYSTPPGRPTPAAEDVFYLGQLELVYRVSRAHSAWFDTQSASPDFVTLLLGTLAEPGSAASVRAEVRGATGFVGTGGTESDAATLDAYGNVSTGSVEFLGGAGWHASLDEIDGARYVQVRLTLANDLERGLAVALDHVALAFQR